jgi:hypothetical protein
VLGDLVNPEDVLTMTDWAGIGLTILVGYPLLAAFARWLEREETRAELPPVNRKIRR